IPGALDRLAENQPATLRLDVEGALSEEPVTFALNPADFWDGPPPPVQRPRFLAIVASNSLATVLARKASGKVDGFVFESPIAGGHNAPPRGHPEFNAQGEPVYGPRDVVDFAQVRELGLPFWIAGGAGSPGALAAARAAGAAGIQVGTLFAYTEESGLDPALKHSVLTAVLRGEASVYTDAKASPTGYPFKVVHWPGDPSAAIARTRRCDLGYLRVPYQKPGGGIGYRCAGEPEASYVQKGGRLEDTIGRRCLCNGLLAVIGHGQIRDGEVEAPLLTSGDDLLKMGGFLAGRTCYSADDVLDYLLAARPRLPV
ncbi:MAG TPA: nitronate monooxygenase, partial [Gemmatimonadales bacterium]|nr:nitronate monooxygenase [Gemmatimonadales bacterium]